MLTITKPLTYKSRIQQIGDNNKFILIDNEVFATINGTIISPRHLLTDNITFLNNTFVDVRASHPHDIGCATRKLITSNLTEQDLLDMGLLYLNEKATERERKFLTTLKKEGKYKGDTDVFVFVCDDIPVDYLNIIDVSFSEINQYFKQMLKCTGVSPFMANIMGASVYLNVGWACKKPKPMLKEKDIFKELLIT